MAFHAFFFKFHAKNAQKCDYFSNKVSTSTNMKAAW